MKKNNKDFFLQLNFFYHRIKKYFLLLVFNLFKYFLKINKENKSFVVLICSYNNSSYIKNNLTSILKQNYNNYRVIYINDASNDDTLIKVKKYKKYFKDKGIEFQIISNKIRIGSTHSKFLVINKYLKDYEIVVVLDGDDSLFSNYGLRYLNYIYQKKNILMTYGSYLNLSGKLSFQKKYPKKIIIENNFRKSFHPSHLRSYYSFLFKKIDQKYFKDKNNKFFTTGEDKATMYPLLELAGKRHKFIPFFLYLYNDTNPIGLYGNKKQGKLKLTNSIQIKKMKKINPINF